MGNGTTSRAVDHEVEFLESFVTKTRDRKAARKSPKKTTKEYGRVDLLILDLLRPVGAA
jgi:putative transposase